MKIIELTSGEITLVDDADYKNLSQYKWYGIGTGKKKYAYWFTHKKGKNYRISMSRFIMNAPDDMEVDHINRNPLDNRRSNLRIVTHAQNMKNLGFFKNNTSGYKGVYFRKDKKDKKKWFSTIKIKNKFLFLGYFISPLKASLYYEKVRKEKLVF